MDQLQQIRWFGHASFSFVDTVSKNRIYYIDPFDLPTEKELEKADLVFITHAHPDHCSQEAVNRIMTTDTCFIAPIDCLQNLKIPETQQFPVLPHEQHVVRDFIFTTLPAYNTKPNAPHPKENNWVGYVFTLNGQKIYHAGDTDIISEMETLKHLHLDVAMLPMGGTYTMDVFEAAKAANIIKATYTIPMHYKRLLGEKYIQAEEQFKKLVTESTVVILSEYR